MNNATRTFLELSQQDLRVIAEEIRGRRLGPPYAPASLGRYLGVERAKAAAGAMQMLHDEGLKPEHLALLLGTIAEERSRQPEFSDTVELVATGPEAPGMAIRDTAVVVRELFSQARARVIVAGYAVFQGKEIFRELGKRMDEVPDLQVDMFLAVKRGKETSLESEILQRFARDFSSRQWPGPRLPRLYYDPRSLEKDPAKRASLHAKCIVADSRCAFVSSANFTAAAQARNIEVGILIRDAGLASKLAEHFESLVVRKIVARVPGLGGEA
ncbi:MAG: phospholipase [Planctomycetes bacterium]|nr:phospholipase [Planctomycetota bacterium]